MIPSEFTYLRPSSLAEALDLLGEHGDEAKILAGGHSLIPMMKLRLATPSVLIDIGRIAPLHGITSGAGTVSIGALTTHEEVGASVDLRESFPIMAQATRVIGDPMVRRRGTFGGALAHADPAADWPAVALALDATMHITGSDGDRAIGADDFFLGLFTTAVAEGEIVTRIDLKKPAGQVGMAYQKFAHPASGYAVVGVAAVVATDNVGTCTHCRVAITGAGPVTTRASASEAALLGERLTEDRLTQAAAKAADTLETLEDIFASADYRAHLTRVYAGRALRAAAASAHA